MLVRIATITKLPDDFDRREAAANKLAASVSESVLKLTDQDQDKADLILKSPALFAISSAFALAEHMKNVSDAGGNRLDIYVRLNKDNTVTCILKDDGPGFPKYFLDKKPNEKMVNYTQKFLMGEDGFIKSQIKSTKKAQENKSERAEMSPEWSELLGSDLINIASPPNQQPTTPMTPDKQMKGGRGLGLATVARVLHDTGGSLEIGNFKDLPKDIKNELRQEDKGDFDKKTKKDGHAILMATSALFNQALVEKCDDATKMTGKYANYVRSYDHDREWEKFRAETAESTDTSEENDSESKTPPSENLSDLSDEPSSPLPLSNFASKLKIDEPEIPISNESQANLDDSQIPSQPVHMRSFASRLGLNLKGLNIEKEDAPQIDSPPQITIVETKENSDIPSQPAHMKSFAARLGLNLKGVNIEKDDTPLIDASPHLNIIETNSNDIEMVNDEKISIMEPKDDLNDSRSEISLNLEDAQKDEVFQIATFDNPQNKPLNEVLEQQNLVHDAEVETSERITIRPNQA